MTNTENTQQPENLDPNAKAPVVDDQKLETADAPEVKPDAAKIPAKRTSTKRTSAKRQPAERKNTAPVSEAQHVVLRSIEGGHITRRGDGYALPAQLTDASVTAVITKGLAEHGPDGRTVMLTKAGRLYLAGRDA